MTVLLDIKDLSVVYRTGRDCRLTAVDHVSFSLAKGQSLGLVGESGSGKSTIGSAILGLLPDNADIPNGRILFNGVDLLRTDPETLRKTRWKEISMIFQSAMNALNPIQRVGDQIVEAITVHEPETTTAMAVQRVRDLYAQMGIPLERLADFPHQYSGGMRQRAIIAMALSCRPKLIIADEPTTALDVIVQDQILRTIAELQRTLEISILFISHDIAMIADACQYVGVLYAGQLVEIGSRAEVLNEPGHPYTRALLGAHITLSGDRTTLAAIPGSTPDVYTAGTGCRFVDRCVCAGESCRLTPPQWCRLSETHWVRCAATLETRL